MAICDNILCKFHRIPFSGVGGVAHKKWVSPFVNDSPCCSMGNPKYHSDQNNKYLLHNGTM